MGTAVRLALGHAESSGKGNSDNEGCFVQGHEKLDCRESATQTEVEVSMMPRVANLSEQVAQLSQSDGEPISTRIMSRCESSAETNSEVSSSFVLPRMNL